MQNRQSTPDVPSHKPDRRWANRLSTVLFIASLLFGAAAVYLYVTEDDTGAPAPPTAEAGRNEYVTVMNALEAQDLSVDDGRFQGKADQLTPPGQVINVNDVQLFVFIYPGEPEDAIAAREADAEDLDPETVQITARQADRPLNEGQETRVFQASNIIVILVGGDEETVSEVEAAIESLP